MEKIHYEIIPEGADVLYEQRETGITHSPFQLEYVIYQAIREGNVEQVQATIEQYMEKGLIIGRLSGNGMRQLQYWAVACISVAIHYAILGGLDETEAFNRSDVYIRHVDRLTTMEACIAYLTEKAFELTKLVEQAKAKQVHSPAIRQCIHFIHIHLHEKLPIAMLAKEVGLSRDYLSYLFKKEVGTSLHSYILGEKLEASKILLVQGKSYAIISYDLAFCSETHYICCFKKRYGMTPGAFRQKETQVK